MSLQRMSPQLLALRTLMLGRPRSVLAVLLIAAGLCVLDLSAGSIAGVRARLEHQAVTGEQLGHLTLTRAQSKSVAGSPAHGSAFKPGEAAQVTQLVEAMAGVARVVPQMSVEGTASTGQRSTLLRGEGIGSARSLQMPFELTQSLVATEHAERLVVYLADPQQLDAMRQALRAVLRTTGLAVDVHTWQELSLTYIKGCGDADFNVGSVAGMVFAVIAAIIAATISMNALERRREVATLRVLGMRSRGVFLMYAAEALWMAAFAVVISVVASGLIAWVVNRVALSTITQQTLMRAPMLVELDFTRMAMAMLAAMAVALLASLAPAFKAARADVAEGLAA